MMTTTDNDSSTISLEVVKQEQVPIEENFRKVLNSQIETKSCLSNIITDLDNFDKKISQPLQAYTPNFYIEILFLISAKSFNTLNIIFYLVFIFFYSIFIKKNPYIFIIVFIHVIIGLLITLIIKKIIGRERPILTVKRYFYKVRTKELTNSMPSGDSLQSANFSMMIILYLGNNSRFFSLLFIPMSMIGRVFYSCHYWFDCFIGAFLGIIISYGCYLLINKFNLNNF
jgi:membrane-associated phospholipid phosphatase